MHLISWNVASWPTTVKRIKEELNMTIVEYFQALKGDIFCLQEVKLTKQKLESHQIDVGTRLKEYESFWAVST